MRRVHFRPVEALETRMLLTAAHMVPAHATPAEVSVPVSIDGTLNVNANDSSQFQNLDGSWTTTVPVSGQLATLGKVHGYWDTRVDALGDYLGPDTLNLQSSKPKGSITIDFNNENSGKPKKVSPELGFYQHAQHIASDSGAFAKDGENGSIELMVNSKKGSVANIVLITVPPATPVTG